MLVAQSCLTVWNPWTAAYQAPLSMRFSRQGYWIGLPFPSPGDLPNPGIEPGSPALQADSLLTELQGKPSETMTRAKMKGRIVTILSSICSCYYYFQNSHIPKVCFLISALFQWSIPAIEAAVFIIVTV